MPLIHGKSKKAFSKNVETEMHYGKPLKQSLAIAYAMKRKAKKMAEGGDVDMTQDTPPQPDMSPIAKGMKKAFHSPGYAKGGFVHEEKASGYEHMPTDVSGEDYPEPVPNLYMEDEEDGDEMINHIMHQRYSKGGVVANDVGEGAEADFEPNQFDDLVKDDHLEPHEEGSNEIGDEEHDEELRDMVHQIMKSRKKKAGHNPHPA